MMHRTTRIAVWVAVAGAGLLAAHARLVRPWALRWGATTEEAARPLPGDELVTKADYIATRAITIEAPPRDVWPWLVQIGSGRAGWYTYDRLDNAGVPSATEIIPALQQLQVGDLIPMVAGKDIGVWVKELEPERRMLWWDEQGEYSWEWLPEPIDPQTTRLLQRLRVTRHPWTRRMLYELVAANGDVVMQRKLLRGIKQRAERLAAHHRNRARCRSGHEPGSAAPVRCRRGRGRAGLWCLVGPGVGPLRPCRPRAPPARRTARPVPAGPGGGRIPPDKVRAPAAITLAAAKETDLQSAPIAKGIFWLRAVRRCCGESFRPQESRASSPRRWALGGGCWPRSRTARS